MGGLAQRKKCEIWAYIMYSKLLFTVESVCVCVCVRVCVFVYMCGLTFEIHISLYNDFKLDKTMSIFK